MKLLHVIPSLQYCGAAKQLTLLSRGLQGSGFEVQVGVLGNDASCADVLRAAGIPVHVFGKTQRLDLVRLWKLRRLLRSFQPHVVHAWGGPALHALALVGGRFRRRVVAGNLLPPPPIGRKLPLWDRWRLRAARFVARGQAEANRFLHLGLPAGRITVVPPAVDNSLWAQDNGAENDLPGSSRLIVCAGNLEPYKGFRDAIWALDILKFLFDDLRLVLIGAGPDRIRLERFTQRIQLLDRVHFLGARADVPDLLARAEMVWVPSLADGGTHIALEAMAAAKPVIASNVPSLQELIVPGETGFLISPGDKVALGRRTRELLRDPDLARRLGQAGQSRAQFFSADCFVNRFTNLYYELAG